MHLGITPGCVQGAKWDAGTQTQETAYQGSALYHLSATLKHLMVATCLSSSLHYVHIPPGFQKAWIQDHICTLMQKSISGFLLLSVRTTGWVLALAPILESLATHWLSAFSPTLTPLTAVTSALAIFSKMSKITPTSGWDNFCLNVVQTLILWTWIILWLAQV